MTNILILPDTDSHISSDILMWHSDILSDILSHIYSGILSGKYILAFMRCHVSFYLTNNMLTFYLHFYLLCLTYILTYSVGSWLVSAPPLPYQFLGPLSLMWKISRFRSWIVCDQKNGDVNSFQLIFNWFQLIFNWFQFTFNWFQWIFNLLSIDFNWFSINFQLISMNFQFTFNWFQLTFNWFQFTFNWFQFTFNWFQLVLSVLSVSARFQKLRQAIFRSDSVACSSFRALLLFCILSATYSDTDTLSGVLSDSSMWHTSGILSDMFGHLVWHAFSPSTWHSI